MNGLIIYRPDGTKHRASDAEQKKHDQWAEDEYYRDIYEKCLSVWDLKRERRMLKRFKEKGFIPAKTRSVYGWRAGTMKAASLFRWESWIHHTDKNGDDIPPLLDWKDWDPIAFGEGTMWRLFPRLRFSNTEVFDVWVIAKTKTGKIRRRLIKQGFKSLCDPHHRKGERSCPCGNCKQGGACGRESCAYCWAGENLNLKDNETIRIERREVPMTKVDDPAGVNPHGHQSASAQDLGEDQRRMFSLTSTPWSYKKGNSKWR